MSILPIELLDKHPQTLMRIILLIPHILVIYHLLIRLLPREPQTDEAIRRFLHMDTRKRVLLPLFPYYLVLRRCYDLGRECLRLCEELGDAVPLTRNLVPSI